MNTLPTPAPLITSANKEFWDATVQGRFQLQRCTDCNIILWFPRRQCSTCWKENLATFDACGKGIVYSFTIVRKGSMAYAESAPFVIAYVELEEGPRVMTNIVGCDPESVTVGMAVEMVFHDTGSGNSLYRFQPASR